jgi:hypothetical protein
MFDSQLNRRQNHCFRYTLRHVTVARKPLRSHRYQPSNIYPVVISSVSDVIVSLLQPHMPTIEYILSFESEANPNKSHRRQNKTTHNYHVGGGHRDVTN